MPAAHRKVSHAPVLVALRGVLRGQARVVHAAQARQAAVGRQRIRVPAELARLLLPPQVSHPSHSVSEVSKLQHKAWSLLTMLCWQFVDVRRAF